MVLNNKILRTLQNAPRDSKAADVYNNFNKLTLPNLHKFDSLLFVQSFFIIISYLKFFHHIVQKNTYLHNHNTCS